MLLMLCDWLINRLLIDLSKHVLDYQITIVSIFCGLSLLIYILLFIFNEFKCCFFFSNFFSCWQWARHFMSMWSLICHPTESLIINIANCETIIIIIIIESNHCPEAWNKDHVIFPALFWARKILVSLFIISQVFDSTLFVFRQSDRSIHKRSIDTSKRFPNFPVMTISWCIQVFAFSPIKKSAIITWIMNSTMMMIMMINNNFQHLTCECLNLNCILYSILYEDSFKVSKFQIYCKFSYKLILNVKQWAMRVISKLTFQGM